MFWIPLIQKITFLAFVLCNCVSLRVGSQIIRALGIIFATVLYFNCQFVAYHACFKQYKAYGLRVNKNLYHKPALRMSFFDTNYLECSNNFAADFTCVPIISIIQKQITAETPIFGLYSSIIYTYYLRLFYGSWTKSLCTGHYKWIQMHCGPRTKFVVSAF